MTVIGLDLSLTASGIATGPGPGDIYTLKPTVKGVARLHWIRNHVVGLSRPAPRLVVIEAMFAGKFASATVGLAELHGVVKLALYSSRVPYLLVDPKLVKMYATGNGNAAKAAVIGAAVKRGGIMPDDDNQADAWWLQALGRALLGQPLVDLPQTHTRALANLRLPTTS